MKSTPQGWPRIAAALYYPDPAAAIDWLCRVYGFAVRLKVEGEGGVIVHSELTYGDGVIMVAGTAAKPGRAWATYPRSPSEVGGANTQNLMVYIDDADAHCARARAAGATINCEPTTSDYGKGYWVDRSYETSDLGGHHWWFVERIGDSKA